MVDSSHEPNHIEGVSAQFMTRNPSPTMARPTVVDAFDKAEAGIDASIASTKTRLNKNSTTRRIPGTAGKLPFCVFAPQNAHCTNPRPE